MQDDMHVGTAATSAQERPVLLLLVGPTAVGKTEVALELADALDGEIVSLDSRTFYRGMDIGTAKPSVEDRARVPHHLIDIADPDQTLSLAQFQSLARESISGILQRRRSPILVGGTGQYVRAFSVGWQPPSVAPNNALRTELDRLVTSRGGKWLHDRLAELDPAAALGIDPRNVRRTIRAFEVLLLTGRRFSEQRGQRELPYRILTVGLKRPREDLYARIDARIESMWARGLLDETRRLLGTGYASTLPSMSAIGYAECAQVIAGDMDTETARKLMRRRTRAFVRRQANWFKESDPAITWIDATQPDAVASISTLFRRAGSIGGTPS